VVLEGTAASKCKIMGIKIAALYAESCPHLSRSPTSFLPPISTHCDWPMAARSTVKFGRARISTCIKLSTPTSRESQATRRDGSVQQRAPETSLYHDSDYASISCYINCLPSRARLPEPGEIQEVTTEMGRRAHQIRPSPSTLDSTNVRIFDTSMRRD
jgi:hypothetical protein